MLHSAKSAKHQSPTTEEYQAALKHPGLRDIVRRAVEEHGTEFLRESTRRVRRAALLVASTCVASLVFQDVPTRLQALDLNLKPFQVQALLLVSLLYLGLVWWVEGQTDLTRTKARFRQAKDEIEVDFEHHLEVLSASAESVEAFLRTFKIEPPLNDPELIQEAYQACPAFLNVTRKGDFASTGGRETAWNHLTEASKDSLQVIARAKNSWRALKLEVSEWGVDDFSQLFQRRIVVTFYVTYVWICIGLAAVGLAIGKELWAA